MTKQKLLSKIPSVDELVKNPRGEKWLKRHPRRTVLKAIRTVLDAKRKEILKQGLAGELPIDQISSDIGKEISRLAAYRLKPLINASGVVIHTNLGRAVLSDKAKENMLHVAGSYSNLEYELSQGKRGKRYSHIKDIIKELSGAEDALVVNNNAAAVLICLNTFAKDMEVIVSRGELVEIGGSFRIPEIMESSGAILREVGTTNKTHLSDYENAVSGNIALLLKVHQSNYKLLGFTEEVSIKELVKLGRTYMIPVMTDLGSGCMIDLRQYGIYDEPAVQDVVRSGADIVTFSGDKLLGGPQCGIILGKKKFIQKVQENPLLRAVRVDKLTLAALEATFMQYLDEERACKEIPTLNMLTQPLENIKRRARRISSALKKGISGLADVAVISDRSRAGGGSLPEADFPTFVVSIRPHKISLNALERKLRNTDPPVIARIKDDALLVDARTLRDREVRTLVNCIISALS
ncbi:L-seryl-tRNA(Sec) selenium transferase [bacterium BMS3Abin10]|nr:L-seryl-tRNA(Sec) selenium transferase [bacterium BMS3Abin10]GBE39257.1 L-seryl-tRNA(Sec) selenium transferase [bacterium BMS3Bbin08]HDH51549.1 L-seryl-tRNA(Sec) selenium transferase [Nitrospirota bacterium]HDK41194.1 L-seryl-tRNA(Sec) selenium transferase [Nitrospirota bacterium]